MNISIEGQRFGRLVVQTRVNRKSRFEWVCLCDCGGTTTVREQHLRTGRSKSCGCISREAAGSRFSTHGLSGTRVYRIWKGMIRRCHAETAMSFTAYGALGIIVCPAWHSFEKFFNDMGQPPSSKHKIDRIDNNGNYEPSNCRWATSQQQNMNRRKTVKKKTSSFKGVYRTGRKWGACIRINGRTIDLGRHLTEEDAARAYDIAAANLFGEFACLNRDNWADPPFAEKKP